MANDTNTVIAGRYKGSRIKCSAKEGWAYIMPQNGEYLFFNKLHVLKVEDISSIHTDASAIDTTLATEIVGLGAGMAMSQGKGSKIKKVTWKSGETSLIDINGSIEKAIIVGMYQDISWENENSAKTSEKRTRDIQRIGCLAWLLVIPFVLIVCKIIDFIIGLIY